MALENETWFFNDWIPTGIYNDLMDDANANPLEDLWDRVGGLTIQQLYLALGPDIDFICDYMRQIVGMYQWLNTNDVDEIFANHFFPGCL